MNNVRLPALILLIAISGCDIYDYDNTGVIVGSGEIVSQEMDFQDFTTINNTGVANIYITKGTTQSVTFKAQQNILDMMTGRVRRDQLVIGFADNISIRNSKEISVEITTPGITAISSQGVGDFYLEGDRQSELYINITGVGGLHYRGDPYLITSITGVGAVINDN